MESNFSLRFRLLVYSWQMIFFIILELCLFLVLFSIPILLFADDFILQISFFSFAIVLSAILTLFHRRYDLLKFLETRFGDRKDFLEVTTTSFSIPHMYFVKKSYSRNLIRIPLKDVLKVIVPKNGLELKIKFQYQSGEHFLKFTPDHFKGGEDEFKEITNYFKNMCT